MKRKSVLELYKMVDDLIEKRGEGAFEDDKMKSIKDYIANSNESMFYTLLITGMFGSIIGGYFSPSFDDKNKYMFNGALYGFLAGIPLSFSLGLATYFSAKGAADLASFSPEGFKEYLDSAEPYAKIYYEALFKSNTKNASLENNKIRLKYLKLANNIIKEAQTGTTASEPAGQQTQPSDDQQQNQDTDIFNIPPLQPTSPPPIGPSFEYLKNFTKFVVNWNNIVNLITLSLLYGLSRASNRIPLVGPYITRFATSAANVLFVPYHALYAEPVRYYKFLKTVGKTVGNYILDRWAYNVTQRYGGPTAYTSTNPTTRRIQQITDEYTQWSNIYQKYQNSAEFKSYRIEFGRRLFDILRLTVRENPTTKTIEYDDNGVDLLLRGINHDLDRAAYTDSVESREPATRQNIKIVLDDIFNSLAEGTFKDGEELKKALREYSPRLEDPNIRQAIYQKFVDYTTNSMHELVTSTGKIRYDVAVRLFLLDDLVGLTDVTFGGVTKKPSDTATADFGFYNDVVLRLLRKINVNNPSSFNDTNIETLRNTVEILNMRFTDNPGDYLSSRPVLHFLSILRHIPRSFRNASNFFDPSAEQRSKTIINLFRNIINEYVRITNYTGPFRRMGVTVSTTPTTITVGQVAKGLPQDESRRQRTSRRAQDYEKEPYLYKRLWTALAGTRDFVLGPSSAQPKTYLQALLQRSWRTLRSGAVPVLSASGALVGNFLMGKAFKAFENVVGTGPEPLPFAGAGSELIDDLLEETIRTLVEPRHLRNPQLQNE